MNWRNTTQSARHWQRDRRKADRIVCELCPRHCNMHEGQAGFCKVRGVVDGELRAFSYGRSVAATEEVIETEAVNHYRPGARILSLGNVGCMMSCTFCQNWETSQVKHLDPLGVAHYTPQEVVELCLEHGIEVISWTYNDPVVWHEFVVDTSRLAQRNGIRTLYKSAFYIEERPVAELLECIDIFSLSLKSMSEDFYRKVTTARLQPVLDRIEQVHRSGRHLELSQLVIPELNDENEDLRRTVAWVRDKLGTRVPLHFVAFHPAYKYLHVDRTPLSTLKRARQLALDADIEHCYLGNVYEAGLNDTRCSECDAVLVARFGLTSSVVGLDAESRCTRCSTPSPIVDPHRSTRHGNSSPATSSNIAAAPRLTFLWRGDVKSAHIQLAHEEARELTPITISPIGGGESITRQLGRGLRRFIASKRGPDDRGFTLSWRGAAEFEVLPVLDRAHFPVQRSLVEAADSNSAPQPTRAQYETF